MNLVIVATILMGLLVDQAWPRYGQAVVSLAAWLVLVALWARSEPRLRLALAVCLVFATAGEVFLSLVWGLYGYRLGNVPLFVPPGHVLLFFLGTQIAARIPARGEWWIALAALPLVAHFAWSGRDTLGPLLYAVFFACMFLSPARKLYATMFVLALSMEFYGTWIGNWTWSRDVPWLALTADNPPLTAGVFYCMLDLLVVTVVGRWFVPGGIGDGRCSGGRAVGGASEVDLPAVTVEQHGSKDVASSQRHANLRGHRGGHPEEPYQTSTPARSSIASAARIFSSSAPGE